MVVAKKRSAQIVQRTCDVAGLREKFVAFTREFQEYRRKTAVAQAGERCARAAGFSRRELFAGLSVSLTCFLLASRGLTNFLFLATRAWRFQQDAELLYPPVDLSYFDTPIGGRA